MDARAVVEDVAVQRPKVAVLDFATVLDVFYASVVAGKGYEGRKVGAQATEESGACGAAGQGFADKVLRGNAGARLDRNLAVAFPDSVEQ